MSTLLIRKDSKQGWKNAARQVMKDSIDRLKDLAQGMNEELGWAKYSVQEDEPIVPELVIHEPVAQRDVDAMELQDA